MSEENNGVTAVLQRVKANEGRPYLRKSDFKTDAEWQQYKAQRDAKRRKKIQDGGELVASDGGTALMIPAATVRKTDLSRLKGRERFCTSPHGGPLYVRLSYCKILNLVTGEIEDKVRGDVWLINVMPARSGNGE